VGERTMSNVQSELATEYPNSNAIDTISDSCLREG
jgi:hypothetical protein